MSSTPALSPRVVIGIVQDTVGRFLVIERVSATDALRFAFPGGKVENGESDAAAVIREVFEETGIRCRVQRPLGERIHPDTQQTIAYFLCLAEEGATPQPSPREAKTARFYSGAEALALFTTDIFAPVQTLLQAPTAKPARTPAP